MALASIWGPFVMVAEDATDSDLDLRGAVCPMAFVKLRLFADGLRPGDVFSVIYEDTAGNEPLMRSIEGVGHTVLENTVPRNESGLRLLKIEIGN